MSFVSRLAYVAACVITSGNKIGHYCVDMCSTKYQSRVVRYF